jgi:hypothetical protein
MGGPRASDSDRAGGVEESRVDAIRLGFGRVVLYWGGILVGFNESLIGLCCVGLCA